jgi:hypothetical protein
VIFTGNIKQYVKGKENNTDTFLEIRAGDGDLGYVNGRVNTTFAPGTTFEQEMNFIANSMGLTVDQASKNYMIKRMEGLAPSPRGKVITGLARDAADNLATNINASWFIENNQIRLVALDSYMPSEIIKINSLTGMIGIPEATSDGINVRCLLNPQIRIGRIIQINEKDVTQTQTQKYGFPAYTDLSRPLSTSTDGHYKVLVAEYSGDTRGPEWYVDLVCRAMDPTAQPADSVKQ